MLPCSYRMSGRFYATNRWRKQRADARADAKDAPGTRLGLL